MSDLLTTADLENAKKHDTFHSEVITGKEGGLSTGANIDYATNDATGQVQKTMPKIINDLDWSLVGDFASGVTFTKNTDLAADSSGNTWRYTGSTPFTAAPGTTPAEPDYQVVQFRDFGSIANGIELKHRRGTNAEILSGIPANGELWFNITDNSVHMGDGATQGGIKQVSSIDVKNFGAMPGLSDQSAVINQAIASCSATGLKLIISPSVLGVKAYRVSSSVIMAASGLNVEFTGGAYLEPTDSDVLTPLVIGGTNQPSGMVIKNPKVQRSAYDGGTENIGILYLEFNQSTIENPESRFSKYNHVWEPTVGGSAYNVYLNAQGVGGFYNFWMKEMGLGGNTGFVNENDFVGGRGFTTGNTNTNFRCDGGANPYGTGHNRISMSLEGGGVQGVYDNGDSNQWLNCRSEGAWTSGAFHVFGPDCFLPLILSSRLDYTIDPSAAPDASPQILGSYRMGSRLSTAINGMTTQTLRNDSASAGAAQDLMSTRDNDDAYAWRAIREIAIESGTHDGSSGASTLSDSTATFTPGALVGSIVFNLTDGSKGVITANTSTTITANILGGLENYWDDGDEYAVYLFNATLTTSGKLKIRRSIEIEQSGYNFEPFRMGDDWFWMDNNFLRHHGTAPTAATDGRIMVENQTSVAAGLGNIANVVNTTDKYAGKEVFDTGLNRPVWATGPLAGSTWVFSDGTTAYTPT